MKRFIICLFLLFINSISYGRIYALRFTFAFDSDVTKTEIYNYVITKASITVHKIQEEIVDYGFNASSGTYTMGAMIRLSTRAQGENVLKKLKWLRDNYGNRIMVAEVWLHKCGNNVRVKCGNEILVYRKNEDTSEYINWDIIDGL